MKKEMNLQPNEMDAHTLEPWYHKDHYIKADFYNKKKNNKHSKISSDGKYSAKKSIIQYFRKMSRSFYILVLFFLVKCQPNKNEKGI